MTAPRTYDGATPGEKPPTLPCWLCGKPIAVRRSKDGHRFLTCLDCGMQIFIRSMSGEERLTAKCRENNPGAGEAGHRAGG